ncbi:PREDICTED: uncharacterized protein LOC109468136 isoform X2 [Branchiostoma belcheri]|uniref:Uncharacterized protein LOC109468136 isoform X2 n=1 Tax=Branchiostoma belcheri TaxID=7741 RepID=A0A6P4YBX8_BRABE|nr:PREDICTED: uncharacterized protein LOC109468136 isoform X2 [Branchiostoma belcheri]
MSESDNGNDADLPGGYTSEESVGEGSEEEHEQAYSQGCTSSLWQLSHPTMMVTAMTVLIAVMKMIMTADLETYVVFGCLSWKMILVQLLSISLQFQASNIHLPETPGLSSTSTCISPQRS